jgi:hypothetical protein
MRAHLFSLFDSLANHSPAPAAARDASFRFPHSRFPH